MNFLGAVDSPKHRTWESWDRYDTALQGIFQNLPERLVDEDLETRVFQIVRQNPVPFPEIGKIYIHLVFSYLEQ